MFRAPDVSHEQNAQEELAGGQSEGEYGGAVQQLAAEEGGRRWWSCTAGELHSSVDITSATFQDRRDANRDTLCQALKAVTTPLRRRAAISQPLNNLF